MRLVDGIGWIGVALAIGAACTGPSLPTLPDPVVLPEPSTPAPWEAPENTWPITAPPAGLESSGFEVGDVFPDVRLVDQYGDVVSLWQFWGQPVLVTISALWCNPCHDLAVLAPPVCDELDVTLLTILEEDGGGLTPEVEDAVAWGEMFGTESPILVDPDHVLSPALRGSYPAVLLLDGDLVVVARAGELTTESLHDLIESEL